MNRRYYYYQHNSIKLCLQYSVASLIICLWHGRLGSDSDSVSWLKYISLIFIIFLFQTILTDCRHFPNYLPTPKFLIKVLVCSSWYFFKFSICLFGYQVEEQKMTVQFELENLEFKLDPEPLLTDMIHAVSS